MTGVSLLDDWRDPYGPLVLTEHDGFYVVRDDMLRAGSKARFVDALVSLNPQVQEWVFGSSPAHGWAQLSLTEVCARHNKQAVFFMADRKPENRTAQQKLGIAWGGIYHWVPNGMLTVTQARAREYANQKPLHRRLLPIGLEDPIVLAAIVKVARQLSQYPYVRWPHEIWTVASSGTLSRGLQAAFPHADVHAVSVGHKMTDRELGRAKLWRCELPFDKPVPPQDMPPYTSVANYDAKVWPFVRDHAKPGALIWNVAGDLK